MYYYLGYYEKFDKYKHVRIIAQGCKQDKEELKEVAYASNVKYSKESYPKYSQREYRVIEAHDKSEAMNVLSNIAKEN